MGRDPVVLRNEAATGEEELAARARSREPVGVEQSA